MNKNGTEWLNEREITITQEEYKDLLESKILMQNAARILENREKNESKMLYIDEVKEMLGIE